MRRKILDEIKRLGSKNGGKPPGMGVFERETGITEGDWRGIYWARWGDAIIETGFAPNEMQGPIDEHVLFEKLVDAVRHFGRIPTNAELKLFKRNNDPQFPSANVFANRFGSKEIMLSRLAKFAQENPDFGDIAEMIGARDEVEESVTPLAASEGHVYLIK
jgi:hypothetical protein